MNRLPTTTEEEFYKAIKPTAYLARAYALVPFSFKTKKIQPWTLTLSVAISSYYFYGVSQVYISMYNNPILPKFEKLMLMLQVTATSSVAISSWLVNHLRFEKFLSLFEKINYVEDLLVLQGFNGDMKRRRRIQYYFIFSIAFVSLQNVFDNVILGENIMALFIIYTIAMLTLSHFLLVICTCRQYYTFINRKIKSIGDLSPKGLTDIVKFADDVFKDKWARPVMPFQEKAIVKNTLKIMMECHSELYEICNKINKYFGLQILANVTANILNVTSICYYVPAIVIDQSDKPHHYMIISIKSVLFIALFAFIQLWLMAFICSSTSEEANFTGILVHGVMNQPKFSCIYKQLDTFSTQLLHQRVNFTAHGFFTIDFSLINTVIGVVITYIVILIQFQMSN